MNRAMAKPSPELLRKVRLFESLEDKDLESLAEEFNERRFQAGHAVALEGEGGLVFFVVESGEATVIDRRPRTATVTAKSDLLAYSLPVFVFRPFVESRPQVAWTLLEAMADRLEAAESR
jgi:CRP-like cAMP-binding protein